MISQHRFDVASIDALHTLCGTLARCVKPGLVIGLSGPLGVGKTEFVRSLLTQLAVSDRIVSPTFVLETRYAAILNSAPIPVYHWDLYRLAKANYSTAAAPEDLLECAADEQGLLLVEWPERISEVVDLLDIRLMLAFNSSVETAELSNRQPLDDVAQGRHIEVCCGQGRASRVEKSKNVVEEWVQATR